jgi:hypothetical protein
MIENRQTKLFADPIGIIQENFDYQVRHLTFLLITATGIDPERNNLRSLLGSGHETDNIQTIHRWVRKELCCPSCARAIKPGHLYAKLNAILAGLDNL